MAEAEAHDRALVAAIIRGDKGAWRQLAAEHYESLYSQAVEKLGSQEMARQAVQEAFEIVFKNHLAQYERWDSAGWHLRNLLEVNLLAVLDPRHQRREPTPGED
jgi:hypothetical protein